MATATYKNKHDWNDLKYIYQIWNCAKGYYTGKTNFLLPLFSQFFFKISLATYEMSRIHLVDVATDLLWWLLSNMPCDLKSSALMSSKVVCQHVLFWEAPPVTITKHKLQWNSGILMECIHSPDRLTLSRWRHQMETFSALLILCAVTGEFPTRPVPRSFDVFFDLRVDKRLSKQSWGWWFETPSSSIWRHCNIMNSFKIKNYSFSDIAWGWYGAIRVKFRA